MRDFSIRRAAAADAALLAGHRAAVWVEVGDWDARDLAPQIPVWTAYFNDRIADATYAAFVAEERGEPIASGGILVHAAIPRPGSPSARAGRVQSVYVIRAARRNGVARALVERLLALAREEQLISLALHPSHGARRLYTSLGFAAADELQLRLHPA